MVGFDYMAYWPHILTAAAASIAGHVSGQRLGELVSEKLFRLMFKLLVTLVGLRLAVKGVLSLAGYGAIW